MSSRNINKQKEYWLKELSGEIPALGLPFDYPQPKEKTFIDDEVGFEVDKRSLDQVYRLAERMNADVSIILLCVFKVLLWKYTSQEDILIGLILDDKKSSCKKQAVLRTSPEGSMEGQLFLAEVERRVLAATENCECDLEEIMGMLSKEQSEEKTLFNTGFLFSVKDTCDKSRGTEDIPDDLGKINQGLCLALKVYQCDNKLTFYFNYNSSLFKKDTIMRMVVHFNNILREIVNDPVKKLSDIEVLSEVEKRQLFIDFNSTKQEYPKSMTIHEVFEQQAEKVPDRVAVIFEDKCLTYKELNQKSNILARLLRENGIGPGRIAGVMAERSLEMLVGILGILKAGGAYLPISPEYPDERIKFMLEDSNASVLLTQKRFLERGVSERQVIDLEDERNYRGDGKNLSLIGNSSDLAYIIYTSGSTGKPKGVMIEHYSVINRLNWMQKKYPIGAQDVILQKTPFTFDVSVWELFWWFFIGAKVCFLVPGGEKEPHTMIEAIDKNKVTVMHFVPSMLSLFLDTIEEQGDLDRLDSLRYVFASGEALNPHQVNKFNALLYKTNKTQLNNLYGPTEATVDVSYFDCSTEDVLGVVPIGKPIDNINLYVLDKYRNMQPVGVPGELYIAGDGLARGYLNRPELTGERFVPNPFNNCRFCTVSSPRMYKTGDLARWLPDGNIEYLGRIDQQVKIRGLRIELGEIEAELVKNESINEAVVTVQKDWMGNDALAAYLVSDTDIVIDEIKSQLSKTLPDYMVPLYYIRITKIPLTMNGKLDRKALPKPVVHIGGDVVNPENSTEQVLLDIWKDFFRNEKIGVCHDFFSLGGDSIKAVKLISIINGKLGVSLKLSDIFKLKSVRAISEYIQHMPALDSCFVPLEKVEKREYYPVSFVQSTMFKYPDANYPERYNLGRADLFRGSLDLQRLEGALMKLIERHDVLRTSFHLINGEYVQMVSDTVPFKPDFLECDEAGARKYMDKFVRPFDLGTSPLLRFSILKVDTDLYYFLLDMHHIIFDAVTIEIFYGELWKLYRGEKPEPVPIQYKDYAVWQKKYLNDSVLKKYKSYWMDKLKGFIFTRMPIDISYTLEARYNLETLRVDEPTYQMLQAFCSKLEITKSSFMIGIFTLMLAEETMKKDIAIGLRVSNRFDASLNNVMGCFLEKVVIRSLTGNQTVKEFLKNVHTNVVEAMDHALYPYDLLNREVREHEKIENPELFNIIVNYMVEDTEELCDSEMKQIKSFIIKKVFSKYDINFKIFDRQKNMELEFKYKCNLYSEEKMKKFVLRFKSFLDEVLADGN